jgi:hypothetical protein
MAPIQLQARRQTVGNCVAQVAAVAAAPKAAVSSSEPLLGVDPLLVRAPACARSGPRAQRVTAVLCGARGAAARAGHACAARRAKIPARLNAELGRMYYARAPGWLGDAAAAPGPACAAALLPRAR